MSVEGFMCSGSYTAGRGRGIEGLVQHFRELRTCGCGFRVEGLGYWVQD